MTHADDNHRAALLDLLLSGSGYAVFVKDLAGRYVAANDLAAAIIHRTVPDLIGRTDHDLFPPDVARMLLAEDHEVLAAGEPRTYGQTFPLDLETRDCLTTKAPYRDARGRVLGVLGIARDVTEVRRAEAARRQREATVTALFDRAPVGVWHIDARFLTVYANPEMCRMLEVDDATALAGIPCTDFVAGESLATVRRELERRRAGEATAYSIELVGRRGGRRRVNFFGTPLFAPDGSAVDGAIATVQDVTERQRVEAALRETSDMLRQTLDHTPAVVCISGPDGRCLFANPALERLLGMTQAELRTRDPAEFWPAADLAVARAHDATVLRTGEALEVEEDLPAADGPRRLAGSKFPLRLADGRTVVAGTAIDVSARRRAEERLRESEERYRLIVETAGEGIWVIDADHVTSFVNPRACEMLGYGAAGEMVGRPLAEFMFPEDWPATAANLARRVAGERADRDVRYRRRDGTPLWATMVSSAIRDPAGRYRGTLAMISDATEKRRLDQLRAQGEQSQRLESLGRLAGGVAHDFNNLLAIISGYGEALLRHLPEGHALRTYAEEIERAAGRGAMVIRQLLAYSRRRVGAAGPLDVTDVVGTVRGMLAGVIGPNVTIAVRAEPGVRPVVADRARMEQVLVNLAINGRDAMPDGGTLTIALRDLPAGAELPPALPAGAYVSLAVSDTGHGMSPETLARIFDPFFTTKEVHGTGLGLSIVYSAVREWGGTITVRSEVGRGSTFELFLPAAVQADAAAPDDGPGR